MGRLSNCKVSLLLAGVFLFAVIMGAVGVQPACADSDPPVYISCTVSNGNKKVTMSFDERIYNNKPDDDALKAAIKLSTVDPEDFMALNPSDTVSIVGSTLVIEFNAPLAGVNNKIEIAGETLKDAFGNPAVAKIPITITLDTTLPEFLLTYPKLTNDLGTSVDLLVKANKSGTAYYVVLSDGATEPSPAQVKDGGALPDNRKGSFSISANTEAVKSISGLTSGTVYDIFVVVDDGASGNLSVVKKVTKENTGPPNFLGGTQVTAIHETSLELSVQINKDGKAYYVVLPSGATGPNAQQVKAGTNASGASVPSVRKGNIALTAGSISSVTIAGLEADTGYDIYVAAEDLSGNLQNITIKLATVTGVQTTAFSFAAGYPKLTGSAGTDIKLLVKANKVGTAYYVVIDEGSRAPTKDQVIAGNNDLGDPANLDGSIGLTADVEASCTISELSTETAQVIYVVATSGVEKSALVRLTTVVSPVEFDRNPAQSPYMTGNNTVRIDVRTPTPADVKFGSEVTVLKDGSITAKKIGLGAKFERSDGMYVYSVENYPLKSGNNNISINITNQDGSRQNLRYTVVNANAISVGAEHYTGGITSQSRIDAFDKAVSLDLGRGNSIKNSAGSTVIGDKGQSIKIIVQNTPQTVNLPNGFVPISPFLEIVSGVQDSDVKTYRLDKQAKLTIKYTGLGAVPDKITVWRARNAAFTLDRENLGGLVNQKAGTITIPLEEAFYGYYAVFNSHIGVENYVDLAADGWYYHPVTALGAKGILEAANTGNNPWHYTNTGALNTFGLNSQFKIVRGEFSYVMTRALGLGFVDIPVTGDTTIFTDVNNSKLTRIYRQSIETAARNGLIYGFPNGDFGWNQPLTREQAAAIMARAAGLKLDTRESSVNAALAKLYTDYDQISPWARSSVLACNRAKVMEGFDDGTFKGTEHLTRAQTASLVYRFMQSKKLI